MSANRTPNGPRRAQSARVLARSTRNDSPKPMQPLPADASVRSAKCAFDDPSPTLRLAHRRSSLARGGGTGLWSHTATYEPTTGRDATERPAAGCRSRPARGPAGPPPAPAEKREFTTLFAVDIRFVLGLCKSLLFVRSARGSAGRSGIPRMARLTNANATTLEAALSVPARSSSSQRSRMRRKRGERSETRRETSSDPYAR
jgi:hypothetical protein